MYRIWVGIKLLIMLPGTALHELAHYVPALLFNLKPSLSLLPSFKHNTAGRVTFRTPAFGLAKTIIALMPLLWWAALGLLLSEFQLFKLSIADPYRIDFTLMYNPSLNLIQYLLLVFVSIQLFWAGGLSRKDWENAIDGLASLSGILAISALLLWWNT